MMYFLPFWKSISPFSPDAAQPHDDVMCICNMPVPLWGRFFLLLQKALLAIRDSHATRAQICLTAEERIVLYVKDNGDGITPERIRAARRENHMGIYGIVERVRLLAGRMELSAELPEWTTVYRIELRGRGGMTDESDDCG